MLSDSEVSYLTLQLNKMLHCVQHDNKINPIPVAIETNFRNPKLNNPCFLQLRLHLLLDA